MLVLAMEFSRGASGTPTALPGNGIGTVRVISTARTGTPEQALCINHTKVR